MIATASDDKTVKLWDLNGKQLKSFKHANSLSNVVFSSNGKTILSSGDEGILWTIDGRILHTFPDARKMVFSPDGRMLASASKGNAITIWRTDGEKFQSFYDTAPLDSLEFSPDSKMLVAASREKYAKLWLLEIEQPQSLRVSNSDMEISTSVLSPDGKFSALGSNKGVISVLNLENRNNKTFHAHTDGVNTLAFNPDGRIIASGGADRLIKLWNLNGEEILGIRQEGAVTALAFSPNGKILASGIDNSVRSPAGKVIFPGSSKNSISLWSLDGIRLQTLAGNQGSVLALAFSPDGKSIVSGSGGKENLIKLWSLDGKEIKILRGNIDAVLSVAFSPDGKEIVSGSWGREVRLWNINGSQLQNLIGHSDPVSSVAYSPDGQTVASASRDGSIKLWSLDGKLIHTFSHRNDRWVKTVVFSPDSKLLYSVDHRGTIMLWNLNLEDLTERGCNWLSRHLDFYAGIYSKA